MTSLQTERITLRPLAADDFDILLKCGSDPAIIKYMIWGPYDAEKTKRFLEKCQDDWNAEPVMKYEFAVVPKGSGQAIGCCWLHLEDNRRCGELGWVLHSDFWGKGIMSEVARELIRFGFEDLKLHRLSAYCFADNHGSYKIMEKNKMRREGHYVKSDILRFTQPETWVDVYQYALLEEEYFKTR